MLSILTRWNKTRHIMNIHENTICCYRMLQGEAPPACDASSALGSAGAATIKITHSDKFDTRQVNTCIVYMFHIKAPHCNLQWVARNLSALWRRCDELSRLSISSLQLALELALAPVLLRVQTTTMSKLPMNKPQNIQTALNSRTGHIWCITFVANLFLGNLLLKILFERNFYLQPCAFRGRAFLGSPVRKTWCILYILSNPRGNLAFLEVCGEAAWSCLKLLEAGVMLSWCFHVFGIQEPFLETGSLGTWVLGGRARGTFSVRTLLQNMLRLGGFFKKKTRLSSEKL